MAPTLYRGLCSWCLDHGCLLTLHPPHPLQTLALPQWAGCCLAHQPSWLCGLTVANSWPHSPTFKHLVLVPQQSLHSSTLIPQLLKGCPVKQPHHLLKGQAACTQQGGPRDTSRPLLPEGVGSWSTHPTPLCSWHPPPRSHGPPLCITLISPSCRSGACRRTSATVATM